jgi:hypothetical protein
MKKTNIELIKAAFDLSEVKEERFLEGFFTGRSTKYWIAQSNMENALKSFPFLKNAVAAGLISKDKKTGNYFTTETILSARNDSEKKRSKRQFFSINGDDKHERTTLYDCLITINNLKQISNNLGVSADMLKFSIRYENGNANKVMNYIEVDKSYFGKNEDEIKSNINKLNSMVKYERNKLNEEIVNVA